MDRKNLDALLSLLNDSDPDTFEALTRSLPLNASMIPVLENLWHQAQDEATVARLDKLIHRARFGKLTQDLKAWCANDSSDMIEGAWLMATYQYPDLPFDEVGDAVAAIVKDVWLELRNDMTSFEQVSVLNRILFVKHGLRGDTKEILSLNNVLINNVLRSKKGNYLGLAIIYMCVAQRLNIPVFGVPMPGAFILACLNNVVFGQNVDFYIDPFNGGHIFDEPEAIRFLEQRRIPFDPEFIQPCSDAVTITMLVAELMVLFEQKGIVHKAEDMNALLQELRG